MVAWLGDLPLPSDVPSLHTEGDTPAEKVYFYLTLLLFGFKKTHSMIHVLPVHREAFPKMSEQHAPTEEEFD